MTESYIWVDKLAALQAVMAIVRKTIIEGDEKKNLERLLCIAVLRDIEREMLGGAHESAE